MSSPEELTALEVKLLVRTLSTSHLPDEVKKEVARELLHQCDAVATETYEGIIRKLGYERLVTMAQSAKS